MIRFLLILAALVVAVPAAADPTRSFRAPWLVLDADCTDLYDTPAPPSGAVDLTTLTNWDTKSEA
ncbi:MAG: hypothetical protein GWN07_08335, partial [Actinobacteria bacterium]|nr:hypothetical protein [Actinomycetota bacterium]NIU65489.1 hypothetical protein [Actinomycetota bacterium]NIW27298.1 hypothetical protein [Actinomycetota bacterium]NIX19833.1 hypothetical protein [Actinomycetota bacterium]